MRRHVEVWGIMMVIALLSSYAAVFVEQPAGQTATANQLVIGSQDVITASDGGGGHLSTNDILLIVLIVLAVFGLAAIL